MKRMDSILYVIAEENIDKSSLMQAINLAKKNSAHIKFLRIYDSFSAISKSINIAIDALKEMLRSNLEKNIAAYSEDIEEIAYTCDIQEGIWFVEVIRNAIEIHSDLIILSEPQQREIHFDSDAMHVIRKSPIPVWLIRKKAPTSKKVLVAADLDINDNIKTEVIAKCMGLAGKLIESHDGPTELIVAHCWTLYNEWYLRNIASNISAIQIDDRVNRERLLHEEWFNSFCAKYSHMNISQARLIQGDPEEVIPKLAQEENIDIVVMGTVSRIHIKGLYITSRAETILSGLSCSVITVKPDDFSSPVM